MAGEPIKVAMADYKTGSNPSSFITTGLGSCVGVCLWDPQTKVGGMAHIMLPDSTHSRVLSNRAKYADTCLPLLCEDMLKLGANSRRLIAKIAGGAQMFNFPGNLNYAMKIGERNTEAVKKCLDGLRIRLIAEDTGGSCGRTITFYAVNGLMLIRTIHKGEKTL